MVKLAYTILYVKDVTKSIEFYEKAFGFQRKFITPDNAYGELITGDTTLSFASFKQAASVFENGFNKSNKNKKAFGIEIGFTTDDVHGVFSNAIQNGATPEVTPKVKPWGQTVSYVRDIDGFLVEICTAMI